MKMNESNIDRIVRVVVGLILVALSATGTIGVWGYIGLIFVVTGGIGFCPIYALLKLSTRK